MFFLLQLLVDQGGTDAAADQQQRDHGDHQGDLPVVGFNVGLVDVALWRKRVQRPHANKVDA